MVPRERRMLALRTINSLAVMALPLASHLWCCRAVDTISSSECWNVARSRLRCERDKSWICRLLSWDGSEGLMERCRGIPANPYVELGHVVDPRFSRGAPIRTIFFAQRELNCLSLMWRERHPAESF